jgi:A/G-specific adenine glycosylase
MDVKEKTTKLFFVSMLMTWNQNQNDRSMPWKGINDPYKIWLSEIILQQTRVEQGLAYYNNFVKKYPTINDLAVASENEVFKNWEGLGYYSRCKNLIATAKFISNEKSGVFPNTYIEILGLKGVGPYTAAAISSFAFNLPHAVVDGNVMRVLTRFFGIDTPIDSTEGRYLLNELAQNLLDKKKANKYNQAIMDFGAMVCKPKQPNCKTCLLSPKCHSFNYSSPDEFPKKSKAKSKTNRWFMYFLPIYKNQILVGKRQQKDIWENLYEFPKLELNELPTLELLKNAEHDNFLKKMGLTISEIPLFQVQLLTHQKIHACFIDVGLNKKIQIDQFEYVNLKGIKKLPFPKIIAAFIQSKNFQKTG